MIQVGDGGRRVQETQTLFRRLRGLVVEVGAILGIEGLIEGDVVIPGDDDLGLEISLLQPLYGL